ncbi:hypothetical protein [Dyella sp. S184]|uniref:hypothetical protein n=1 Tax=Dyella sp. S184 TaxID=1641862 RepID=UPI0020B14EE1|nr:hypothetical protein [Dyella sp. S184]
MPGTHAILGSWLQGRQRQDRHHGQQSDGVRTGAGGIDLSTTDNLSIGDVVGHGTWVSEIATGTPFTQFAGGIAPGADLVSARIIDNKAGDDDGSPSSTRDSEPIKIPSLRCPASHRTWQRAG